MSVVFVHVGLPKTGTTFLQDRLWRNRDLALDSAGLLYPGNRIDDHFHAAAHLQPERYLDWADPAHAGAWPAMVAQMRAWPKTSLVSHELFATAGPEQIARLLGDLDFADEVHVILTVRDLGRQLPSVWQENVKNQRQADFAEFLASVHDHTLGEPAESGAEPFWEFQDTVRIARDWGAQVGPERVHLVTVPASGSAGPDALWQRFLGVLGADPAVVDLTAPGTNTSLSASQTEFLRRLNSRLQPDQIAWQRYERVIKGKLIGEVLFAVPAGPGQGLDDEQRAWAAITAAQMVGELAAAGYQVHGSLTDLQVTVGGGELSGPPETEEVLEVALDALAEFVLTAPMPRTAPAVATRAANVVRRVRRRIGALRNR